MDDRDLDIMDDERPNVGGVALAAGLAWLFWFVAAMIAVGLTERGCS